MKKHLVVLDHERLVPPFMISILTFATNHYDQVYYINTHKPDNNGLFVDTPIEIVYPDKLSRFKNSVIALIRFFSLENLKQWINCVKKEGFNYKYVKGLFKYLAADEVLSNEAIKIIKPQKGASVVVLATWFAAAALAAAEMKKKYPEIKAVSLAHSYEILPIRNRFIPYYYVNKKHKYLDGVFFIANKVRELYIDGIGGLKDEYFKKTHVCYLGSYKKHNINNRNNPLEFHICTCSRMIPLKRLDVLIESLTDWSEGDIYWTHLGDGILEYELRKLAQIVMDKNPNVHITFTGYMKNEMVKEYYENNPVDLFINLSSIEGLPISIMEAISYGIPVLATDIGGTSEIVNTDFGFLMDVNITPESVKSYIQSFKLLPSDKRTQMRHSAYQYWETHFDAEHNIALLFDSINQI